MWHDDLAEAFVKIIKRLNMSNISGPRIRDLGSVLSGVPTLIRNTSSNGGNFNANSRNNLVQGTTWIQIWKTNYSN